MGEVLLGRYRCDRLLGRGGAAEVFRAHDLELDRPVAVKVLRPEGEGTIADGARLRQEAQALARLAHPNILEILAIEESVLGLFLVLELADGGSLATQLASQGPRPEAEVREVVAQVLDALAAAHGAGITHRDVKPENVLWVGGRPKLADFGLAKRVDGAVRTATGLILGTPEFMAPECFRGAAAGPPADVYATGCLAFQLAIGRPLFAGELAEVVKAKVAGAADLRRLPTSLRPEVVAMLEPDPRRRPAAAQAAAAWRGGEEDRARPTVVVPSSRLPAVPPPRRRPPWLALVSALALAGGAWWMTRPPPPPPMSPTSSPDPGPAATSPGDTPGAAEARARALADSWRARFDGWAWDRVLETHCRAVAGSTRITLGLQGVYVTKLAEIRTRALPDPAVMQAGLVLVADMGADETWRRDRPAIEALLGDRAVTPGTRQDLMDALEPLVQAEALRRAMGLDAHYGIAAVRDRFAPRELTPWPAAEPEAPALTLGEVLGPGARRGIFAWEREGDRRFPRVDPREPEPSVPEMAVLRQHEEETQGGFEPENHLGVYRRVPLDAAAAAAPWLEVDLRVANFFATNQLVLRVNRFHTQHHGGPELDTTGHWDYDHPTWSRLRIRVPGDYLRAGDNVLEVTAAPMAGLGRWAGFWLERVEVRAGS